MKANVYVTLKPGILDPQGQAVGRTLHKLGFDGVSDVKIGKYIEIEIDEANAEKAKAQVEKMCDELIANTVIENYRVELVGVE